MQRVAIALCRHDRHPERELLGSRKALVFPFGTQNIYNTPMPKPAHRTAKARKSAAMTFRFTPEFRAQLVAAATHEKRSQANLIEWLVEEHCAKVGVPVKEGRLRRKAGATGASR